MGWEPALQPMCMCKVIPNKSKGLQASANENLRIKTILINATAKNPRGTKSQIKKPITGRKRAS